LSDRLLICNLHFKQVGLLLLDRGQLSLLRGFHFKKVRFHFLDL